MSASPTTVPAVKAKLLALFQAAVEPSTEVWGSAKTDEDHQLEENVYIAGAAGRRTFKTFPAGLPISREEVYTITVEVEVYRQGTDNAGTEERLWVVAQQLELAVANSPSLSGVTGWEIAGDFRQSTQADQAGVLASYVFGVTVNARI
jgi:hypothetical protein